MGTQSYSIEDLVKRVDAQLARSTARGFAWHGTASDADVRAIENRLGCRLPASFRTLLSMTGGGGPGHFRISTAAINENGGSVIGDTLYWRETFHLPSHLVVIQCDWDDNEPICLDTSSFTDEECPVVLFYPHIEGDPIEQLASDFLAWYVKFLTPYWKIGRDGE